MARHRTTLAALCACVAVLAGPVARAGDPPVLKETSVDSGWTRNARSLAARYLGPIQEPSDVEVVDRFGSPVPGDSSVSGAVLTFVAQEPLQGASAPYTATFSATSYVPDPDVSVDALTFRVDTQPPRAPAIGSPAPAVSTPAAIKSATGGVVDVNVVLPVGPSPRVFGTAADPLGPEGDDTETSGIARVELRFFPAPGTTEAAAERIVVTQACGIRCADSTWFETDTTLGPGVWTMRAFAFDLAGSQSASSTPLTFVVR